MPGFGKPWAGTAQYTEGSLQHVLTRAVFKFLCSNDIWLQDTTVSALDNLNLYLSSLHIFETA